MFTLVAYNEGLVSIEDLSLLQKTDSYKMFRGTMDKYVNNSFQSDPEAGVPASEYFYYDTEGASADMSIGMYFDLKYPNMDPIYIDSFGNAALRLGDALLTVDYGGWFWDMGDLGITTTNITGSPQDSFCPTFCELDGASRFGAYNRHYCSTPSFFFYFHTERTSPVWGSWYQSENGMYITPHSEEPVFMNNAMEIGEIGCAVSTPGGGGKLGYLELTDDFLQNAQSHDNKPFKLAETYYECVMTDRDAFIESAGIANGTAGLASGIFIALLILMVANTPGFETTGPVVTDQEKKRAVAFLADAARGGEKAAADADAGDEGEGLQIDEGTERFVRALQALAIAIKDADRSAASTPLKDLTVKDPEENAAALETGRPSRGTQLGAI